jgi:class 3 adenylate cyclase
MVTVAAPVYDKDEFLGTVAIDLTVDFLNAFVSKLSAESGTILIFNEKEQLLAHPSLISSNDKQVKTLKEALPDDLTSQIPNFKNASQLKFFSKSKYELFVKHISNADWNILYFREKPPFFSVIFTPMGASFIILLLIVFGIFYILNQLIVKDFIDPSQNLVKYIEQESVSKENLPLPIVPDAWRAWFEQVSEIFQQNRSLIRELQDLLLNLEKKVEERTLELKQANEKNENLLLNILPKKIVSELKTKGRVEPILVPSATILFTDFVNFSRYASTIKPEILVKELDAFFSVMDQITLKYGLEKLKTIGDSYMCAGGLPDENPTHTLSCCIAALEIIHLLKQGYEIKTGEHVWEIRIGIHTGPVVAGIIGEKKFAYDVWGDTVNIASRMESSGSAGKINVSYSVYEAMKDYFEFEPRGKLPIKGIGEVEMFFLTRLKKEFSYDESGFLPSKKFFAMHKEFSQKNEFSI